MSKTISISDKVYEMLKREKNDRSFSEVIEEKIDRGGKLSDVAGARIFEKGTLDKVKDDIREGSAGTVERLEDEVA